MHNYIYENGAQQTTSPRRHFLARYIVVILTIVIVIELGVMVAELKARYGQTTLAPKVEPKIEVVEGGAGGAENPLVLAKKDLADMIGARPIEAGQPTFEVADQAGHTFFVRTTVLPALQALSSHKVRSIRANQAALVVMNPDTGEVLALAGYNAEDPSSNTALAGSFPAASLFKIVTAAAALEKAEMSADSKLAFDGRKHTLYKKSVAKAPDKGLTTVTLRESFADSINSVFGKIGVFSLGQEELTEFANRFGFNHDINFEMPVERSNFSVDNQSEDFDFHLAELASGFNRTTKVSPLHGALLAASVVRGGSLIEPTFVREVFDQNNRIYYKADPGEPHTIISKTTADELSKLMRSAVEDGTGRRTFGTASSHPVLSQLIIGGKSGTINNENGERVDWFVAWAEPKPGQECQDRLAVSAVVVHNWTATSSSQELVRDALNAYYKDKIGKKRGTNAVASRASATGQL